MNLHVMYCAYDLPLPGFVSTSIQYLGHESGRNLGCYPHRNEGSVESSYNHTDLAATMVVKVS